MLALAVLVVLAVYSERVYAALRRCYCCCLDPTPTRPHTQGTTRSATRADYPAGADDPFDTKSAMFDTMQSKSTSGSEVRRVRVSLCLSSLSTRHA